MYVTAWYAGIKLVIGKNRTEMHSQQNTKKKKKKLSSSSAYTGSRFLRNVHFNLPRYTNSYAPSPERTHPSEFLCELLVSPVLAARPQLSLLILKAYQLYTTIKTMTKQKSAVMHHRLIWLPSFSVPRMHCVLYL
jgi:hypothetical protein